MYRNRMLVATLALAALCVGATVCSAEAEPSVSIAPDPAAPPDPPAGDDAAARRETAPDDADEPGRGPATSGAVSQTGGEGPLSRRSWEQIGAAEPLYAPWARVLADHVDEEGLVDYAGLGRDRADLDAFMRSLATTDPSGFEEAAQIAFWINAYNATVIYLTLEHYPLDSVRDVGSLFGLVGGFFKQEVELAGRQRHLDNIEHDILRPTYDDARIHWTLVCGAFGCPRLLRRPYVATDLDALLTELSFEFLANPRALQIHTGSTTLQVSSYFDWYGGDFEAESGDIVDYILRYAPDDKAAWIRQNREALRVRFLDYDWTLNDQVKGPRSRRPIVF